tara:strand:+ start:315 stop:590 length:276 start_codon:yes stop_codon:yes gene_type:complete
MPLKTIWNLVAPDMPTRRYKSFGALVERLPKILESRGKVNVKENDGWSDFSVYLTSTGNTGFWGKYTNRQKLEIEESINRFRERVGHGNAA